MVVVDDNNNDKNNNSISDIDKDYWCGSDNNNINNNDNCKIFIERCVNKKNTKKLF